MIRDHDAVNPEYSPAPNFLCRDGLADAAVDVGLILVLYAPDGIEPVAPLLTHIFRRHSEARVVLSHLGHPDVAESPRLAKCDALFRLAEYPKVYIQLSGMKMFCPWPHEPLYPLIEKMIQQFGPSRVYWGSNFPVVGGPADYYISDLSLLKGRLPISANDVPRVAGSNAKRLWFPEVE